MSGLVSKGVKGTTCVAKYRSPYTQFLTKEARVLVNDTRLREAKYILMNPLTDHSSLYL